MSNVINCLVFQNPVTYVYLTWELVQDLLMNTVNDKNYAGEKFCSSLGFIIMWGKPSRFCFRHVYKISRKTFAVYWKSVKLFSHITFFVYSMIIL